MRDVFSRVKFNVASSPGFNTPSPSVSFDIFVKLAFKKIGKYSNDSGRISSNRENFKNFLQYLIYFAKIFVEQSSRWIL